MCSNDSVSLKTVIEISLNNILFEVKNMSSTYIHLTKFPTLPVIFSMYLKTDFFYFFEIL